jgi:hypothetical protein
MIVRAAFAEYAPWWLEWRLVFYREVWDRGDSSDWLAEAMADGYHGA